MNNAVNLFPTPSLPLLFLFNTQSRIPDPAQPLKNILNLSTELPKSRPYPFPILSTFFLSYLCFSYLIYLFPALSMFFLPYLCFSTLSMFFLPYLPFRREEEEGAP
jgi:hypothetical protein